MTLPYDQPLTADDPTYVTADACAAATLYVPMRMADDEQWVRCALTRRARLRWSDKRENIKLTFAHALLRPESR
jgi:hypothetical protein